MTQSCAKPIGTAPKSVCKQTQQRFRYLAEPFTRDEKINSIIGRAARRLGIEYWRGYEIWYGRAKLSFEEREQIAIAAEAKRREEERNEFWALKKRLAVLESRLAQTDEDFHRETISTLRGALRGRG